MTTIKIVSATLPAALIRIFTTLALFALGLFAVTLLWGLYLGDLTGLPLEQQLRMARLLAVHRLLGIGSALVVVLVNSIVVTYFVGVGRWCKEVVETYQLNIELIRRSAVLKRRTFPWAVCSMLAVVAVGALGAAADTGRLPPSVHLAGALAGLAFVALAFFVEGQRIREHHVVITDILAEVRRIRLERGLDVDLPSAEQAAKVS